jgi:ribosomal-protein-serine acetyltransferase
MQSSQPLTTHVDDELLIRPYLEDDAAELFPRLMANRVEGLWWIDSIDRMQTMDDLLAEFARVRALLDEGKRLGGAVVLNGRIVGSCRVAGLSPDSTAGDLGYWLFPEARGKGIITRCARVLLDHVFQRPHMERITIGVCPENLLSVAVAQRLGFAFERLNPNALFRTGRRWDAAIYGMSKCKWRSIRSNAR